MAYGVKSQIVNELIAWGIGVNSKRIDGKVVDYIVATCCKCGESEEFSYKPQHPTEFIIKRLKSRGWKVEGRYTVCPTCVTERKQEIEEMAAPKKVVNIKDDIGPDPSVKKRIRDFLDGHFDEVIGNYLDGYDDKKVGEELQIPWAWVAEIREKAYGPIKVDPEIQAAINQVQDTINMIAKMKLDLKAKIESFNIQNDALAETMSRLRAKIGFSTTRVNL